MRCSKRDVILGVKIPGGDLENKGQREKLVYHWGYMSATRDSQ